MERVEVSIALISGDNGSPLGVMVYEHWEFKINQIVQIITMCLIVTESRQRREFW